MLLCHEAYEGAAWWLLVDGDPMAGLALRAGAAQPRRDAIRQLQREREEG